MMYLNHMRSTRKGWKVIYYEDNSGRSDVYEFIESRSIREKAKVIALLGILEEKGPQLPRPYADLLTDGIHELRIRLRSDRIRILYFFCFREFIVLTNVFTKSTERVPSRELRRARKLRSEFLRRKTEKDIREEYENS